MITVPVNTSRKGVILWLLWHELISTCASTTVSMHDLPRHWSMLHGQRSRSDMPGSAAGALCRMLNHIRRDTAHATGQRQGNDGGDWVVSLSHQHKKKKVNRFFMTFMKYFPCVLNTPRNNPELIRADAEVSWTDRAIFFSQRGCFFKDRWSMPKSASMTTPLIIKFCELVIKNMLHRLLIAGRYKSSCTISPPLHGQIHCWICKDNWEINCAVIHS